MDLTEITLFAWALALGGAAGGAIVVSLVDGLLRHLTSDPDG